MNLSRAGFTLIELLVVLSIISLFASLAFAQGSVARERSRQAAVRAQLQEIRNAFELYFTDRNDYPPFGTDNCSGCSNPPSNAWVTVANELAPYTRQQITYDPWGNFFWYDKNFRQACWNSWTVLCSTGPNRIGETAICQTTGTRGGDDICVFFSDND